MRAGCVSITGLVPAPACMRHPGSCADGDREDPGAVTVWHVAASQCLPWTREHVNAVFVALGNRIGRSRLI